MIDFSEIIDNIRDFFEEKKAVAILVTVLIALFFLAMIAFVVLAVNPEKETEPVSPGSVLLVPDQKIITPEGPSIPDGYALTREPKDKWTDDETEEFFTLPDTNELNKLESANDNLINEILGATP